MSWLRFLFLPLLLCAIAAIMFVPSLFDSSAGKVEMDERVHSEVINRYDEKVLLLFFGYAGCVDICTPRMEEVATIYREVNQKSDVGVLFINLLPLEDQNVADGFAKYFDASFIGFYPGEKELRKLREEFNIYFARSLLEADEYDHTAFLFMLVKEADGYHLKGIYTRVPFDKEMVLADIRRLEQKR
jgi:protein SCO1/2